MAIFLSENILMMLNVYLLRHGETAWNADGNRYNGRTDLPLTEKGIVQATEMAGRLKNIHFDAVYSSPLQRAFETARIVSSKREVIKDGRLIEVDFGRWEGRTKEEFISDDKQSWLDWLSSPGQYRAGGTGETGTEIINRLNTFYTDLLMKHPTGDVMVVAHNGVNRLFLSHKLGMPLGNYRRFFLDNAAVTLFSMDEKAFLLQKLNAGR